jgi:hypothetical protein
MDVSGDHDGLLQKNSGNSSVDHDFRKGPPTDLDEDLLRKFLAVAEDPIAIPCTSCVRVMVFLVQLGILDH